MVIDIIGVFDRNALGNVIRVPLDHKLCLLVYICLFQVLLFTHVLLFKHVLHLPILVQNLVVRLIVNYKLVHVRFIFRKVTELFG